MQDFTEVLDDLMQEKQFNATQLARNLGCSKTTVCRYLKGTRFPNILSFIKLADFFNCPTDYLYGLSDYYEKTYFKNCPPFSERILFLLERFNVTKKQFCVEADISETSFFLWLNNKGNPTVENVHKIAKYFDQTMDFILGRES